MLHSHLWASACILHWPKKLVASSGLSHGGQRWFSASSPPMWWPPLVLILSSSGESWWNAISMLLEPNGARCGVKLGAEQGGRGVGAEDLREEKGRGKRRRGKGAH